MSDFRPGQSLPSGRAPLSQLAGNQRGGVLLFLLVAVTILGFSAAIAGSTWTSIVQRAKEEDLLWKGNQIRKAIGSYYEPSGEAGATKAPAVFPQSVDDLLKDNRSLNAKRHLRRPYLDPMTGEDWEWIKAPQGGIKGVRSTSKKTPFKKDGFSEENKTFAGMWQYRDWEFIYQPERRTSGGSGSTSGGSTSGGSTSGGSQPTGTSSGQSGN